MKAVYQKNLGLSPNIFIDRVDGSLQVKGWMRTEVYLGAEEDDFNVSEQADGLHFRTHGDCVLRLPRHAMLHVGRVGGSVRLKYLDGEVSIDEIGGSLAARSVYQLSLQKVHGDVLIKGVMEGLNVQEVAGSFIVRELQGECIGSRVLGNLDVRGISGSLSAHVEGHARLEINELTPAGIRVEAAGHIHCETSDVINASVTLISNSNQIQVRLPEGKQECSEQLCTFELGEGGTPINLLAEGKLVFIHRAAPWYVEEDIDELFNDEFERISDEFGRQFQAQIDSQMEMFNQQMQRLSEEMQRAGLPQPHVERLMERARHSSLQASARLQEKMRRAQEKIDQKMAAAQRKAEAKRRPAEKFSFTFTSQPSRAEKSPASAVSEEERLYILKMLAEKKITVEQAETLLKALEGED